MSAIVADSTTVIKAEEIVNSVIATEDFNYTVAIETETPLVVTETSNGIVISDASPGIIVAGGAQGIQGIPGNSIDSVQVVAGSVLGSGRAVNGQSLYPNLTNEFELVLGITKTSALAGEVVEVQTSGFYTEPGWSFTLGPVYVGLNGVLTQVAPTSGLLVIIGYAVTANKLFIDKQPAIFLG